MLILANQLLSAKNRTFNHIGFKESASMFKKLCILFVFWNLGLFCETVAQETQGNSKKDTEKNTQEEETELPEIQSPTQTTTDAKVKTESESILQEIIVTATKTKKDVFDTPYSTTVIDEKELQRRKPRTLPEALSEVPGVMIQKTAHGQGSPFIRGFTGFRTVMLIDGIRLNNSTFREGPNQYWSTVDTLSLDRIEVVQGPSSVLYGSDAIGGTVNAFTKERKKYDKPFEANGLITTRYSSAEASIIGRVEGSANVGQTFGIVVGQNYKQFGDVDAGGEQGRLKRTGYYETDSDLKMNFFLNNDVELVAAYYNVEQENIWRTHRTIFSESFRDTTISTDIRHRFDQERHLAYIRLNVDRFSEVINAFSITGSYHFQDETRDRLRSANRLDLEGVSVSTAGLNAQFHSDSPIGKWTYGFDYYRDFVNSYHEDYNARGIRTARRLQGPVADDATYDLLGIFIQNEVEFHPRLKGIFGVRYTHAWTDAEDVIDPVTGGRLMISDDWGAFVGNAHLIGTLHKNVNMYIGASQGFRAPNLSDLTRLDNALSGELETPTPGLDPEEYLSLEAGLNVKHEWFKGHISYYHTFIDDMIIRFPTGRIVDGSIEVQKANVGDGFVHGVQCSGEVFLPEGFSVFGNFGWLEGRVSTFPDSTQNEKDEVLSKMPPAQALVGVRWQYPEYGLFFEVSSRMARQQKRLNTSDRGDTQRIPPEGTPGYGIISVRGAWEINEYCTVSAAVENILDKQYRVHGSGQDEAGINAILGVDFKF